MPKMLLPDTNVWLALAFDTHYHHPAAKSWFDGLSDGLCYFCRMTQQGLLRLVTNPQVLQEEALTLREAWGMWDTMALDPKIAFAAEPADLEPLWRKHSQAESFSPHVWNDAYLAAFAQAADFEIVSFDKGFAQYADLRRTILS